MELKNTYVVRTDDENFKDELNRFLSNYCERKNVNAAVFELNEIGAEKVMKIVYEN